MIKSLILSSVACGVFLISGSAVADTPDQLAVATTVDAKKAKELVDSKAVTVVDSRVKVEYAEEHLPGALSVQYTEKSAKEVGFDSSKDSFDVTKLPGNKAQALLIYCNGPECWKSFKAATLAVKAGYKTVYWFRTGIPAWKKEGYPTDK